MKIVHIKKFPLKKLKMTIRKKIEKKRMEKQKIDTYRYGRINVKKGEREIEKNHIKKKTGN